MKEKIFKPQLCPNDEIDIYSLSYPLLISTKLDGCRLLHKQGKILTRSLKQLPNKQLKEKFEPIRKYTEEQNLLLDGEIFAENIPFQFIVSCFMTEDCFTKSSIKKWEDLCKEHDYSISREEVISKLKFYCFDSIENENPNVPFSQRQEFAKLSVMRFPDIAFPVEHILVNNAKEVEKFFEVVLKEGYEGLIIRNPKSFYKYNRCTVSENNAHKLKPWATEDAKIIGFIQSTKVNEDVEKTITELGLSRTSKCQNNRHLIEKAQSFIVEYNSKQLSVPISMTDAKKEYIWAHQDEYLNKYIEFKYMTVGMKDLPRIPKFIRMRPEHD